MSRDGPSTILPVHQSAEQAVEGSLWTKQPTSGMMSELSLPLQ